MSHESPVKQIRTAASSFNGGSSPMLPWTASSPLYQFDCFSPEGSNMSFTMTSPPFNYGVDASQNGESNINSSFSPSIFSPPEQRMVGSKLPKKREVYLDHNNGLRNGIAEVNDRGSPESRSESRSAMDLPLLLESPHHGFWSTFSNSLSRPGSNMPTPSHEVHSKRLEDRSSGNGSSRFWPQGLGGEADLLSATSQAMKLSASPLLDGEYLLSEKKNKSRKGGSRRSPGQSLLLDEDCNDIYSSIDSTAGSSKTVRKRKSYVSPEPSSLDSSMELHTVNSSGGTPHSPAGATSIDKLSVAVRNQKFSLASTSKAAGVGGAARRMLKSQPSVLENYDLSQHFDSKHVDETATAGINGDEMNTTTVAKEVTVCNCKKSKCLKLYCDCFAGMNYCSGSCNCFDCCNSAERESVRQEAIRATKERNALAFQTKINDKDQHSTGCHCKNSQCLKKYCECYTGGAFCGSNCKCLSCLNFAGSVDLAKARSSVREDGSGSSRKRKESPSSVAFLDQSTPPAVMAKTLLLAQSKSLGQTITFSPELHAAVSASSSGYSTAAVSAAPSTGSSTLPPATRPGMTASGTVYTPTANALSSRSTSSSLEMASSGKRGRSQQTPVAADRQLRSRKPSADSEESVILHSTSVDDHSITSSKNTSSIKKRHVKFAPVQILYPFFGADFPEQSKLVALKCLDYLEVRDIIAMAQVNNLWNAAAMDEALWES